MKYFCPNSIDNYLAISNDIGKQNLTLFAGGTDLIPRYESGIDGLARWAPPLRWRPSQQVFNRWAPPPRWRPSQQVFDRCTPP